MNCDTKSKGSSYTDVTHMLVPTHVSSCQSWCSCCPSSTKRFKEHLKIPAQAFISQPPQGVLEWF